MSFVTLGAYFAAGPPSSLRLLGAIQGTAPLWNWIGEEGATTFTY